MAQSIINIIGALTPLAIKLILLYLEKINVDKETKKRFYDFIHAMERDSTITSTLRQKYAQQKDRVDAMIKEIEAREGIKK